MELNRFETLCMNNPLRKGVMRWIELRWFQSLLQQQGVQLQGTHMLDVACGSGYSGKLLQEAFSPDLLVGFDLMESQVRLAQRTQAYDVIFQGNLLQLGLASESFDCAFGFGILHHVIDWRQAAREMVRVIKPGGYLILEEPNGLASEFFRRWVRFAIPKQGQFTWPEFQAELEGLGLVLLGKKTLFLNPFQSFLWRKA